MEASNLNLANPGANISMKGNENKQKRGFFGVVGDAVKQTAATVGTGAVVGTAAGGLVSLVPVKNIDGIANELTDAFLNAAKEPASRPYIKPELVKDQFEKAKVLNPLLEQAEKIKTKKGYMSLVADITNTTDEKALAVKLSEYLVRADALGLKVPDESILGDIGALKNNILGQLNSLIDPNVKIDDKSVSSLMQKCQKASEDLIASVKNYITTAPKDDELLKLAKKEASRLRRNRIISQSVYIGIAAVALVSIFKALFPKKAPKNAQNAAPGNVQTPPAAGSAGGNLALNG